jgi:hypothetical protein
MSEQQPLSHKETLEEALNTRAFTAWDPVYRHGEQYALGYRNDLSGVSLEVFQRHDVVRVTSSDMTCLTFPTRGAPHIEERAVVFTNRHSRLTVHSDGQVLWQRFPDSTQAPPGQPEVPGSTSRPTPTGFRPSGSL